MRKMTVFALLLSLLSASCGARKKDDVRDQGAPSAASVPVAPPAAAPDGPVRVQAAPDAEEIRVGPHSVSKRHLALKADFIRFKHGGTDAIEAKAAAQLIQGLLYCAVLEALGKPVTWRSIEEEVARIDRQTQAPEELAKVKKLFEGASGPPDRGSSWKTDYALFFVLLPDFANRKFHFDVFPQEKRIQARRLEDAHAALRVLATQETPDMEAVSKKAAGWIRDEVYFDRAQGFRPQERPGEPPMPGSGDEGLLPEAKGRWAEMDDELFSKTEKGKLIGQVVELDTAFLLMRWTGWKDDRKRTRLVERVIVPKVQSGEYFEEQSRRIPVRFRDRAALEAFKKAISWSSSLQDLKSE